MTGRVAGKVALITGGASGIGRACAHRLAEEGTFVVITDIQDELGSAVVTEITTAGGAAEFLHHDVTDERAWTDVIDTVRQRHGRLDVLVNNAGIGIASSIVELSLADWQRQQAINLDGVFLGIKHAIPLMRDSGGGSIINMSSVAGLKGSARLSAYNATKGVALECAQERPAATASASTWTSWLRPRCRRVCSASRGTLPTACCSWPATSPPTSPAPSS